MAAERSNRASGVRPRDSDASRLFTWVSIFCVCFLFVSLM
jgi:hypothetical protein